MDLISEFYDEPLKWVLGRTKYVSFRTDQVHEF